MLHTSTGYGLPCLTFLFLLAIDIAPFRLVAMLGVEPRNPAASVQSICQFWYMAKTSGTVDNGLFSECVKYPPSSPRSLVGRVGVEPTVEPF